MMQSSRNFVLAALVVLSPVFTTVAPIEAQTQVTSENGVVYQAQTRPQVFKESNATSGQGSQRWANDRDTNHDKYPNQDRDRDRHKDHGRCNHPDHHNGDHQDRRNCTIIVPVYPGYAPYPTYGAPVYPSYPYGYHVPQSGASVTVSTPGYTDGTFTVFPWTSTVTTFGPAPGYYGNYPTYPSYHNYPAYPTYVPNVYGYRGAASPGYHYNGGSFPSGAFITGSTNGYSTGFSAGFSNGRTSITIGGRR